MQSASKSDAFTFSDNTLFLGKGPQLLLIFIPSSSVDDLIRRNLRVIERNTLHYYNNDLVYMAVFTLNIYFSSLSQLG